LILLGASIYTAGWIKHMGKVQLFLDED